MPGADRAGGIVAKRSRAGGWPNARNSRARDARDSFLRGRPTGRRLEGRRRDRRGRDRDQDGVFVAFQRLGNLIVIPGDYSPEVRDPERIFTRGREHPLHNPLRRVAAPGIQHRALTFLATREDAISSIRSDGRPPETTTPDHPKFLWPETKVVVGRPVKRDQHSTDSARRADRPRMYCLRRPRMAGRRAPERRRALRLQACNAS